jgi:hypothetical protein
MASLATEMLIPSYDHVVSEDAVRGARQLMEISCSGHEYSVLWASLRADRPSLLDLQGMGREVWEGIDATAYVNSLRDEWDSSAR